MPAEPLVSSRSDLCNAGAVRNRSPTGELQGPFSVPSGQAAPSGELERGAMRVGDIVFVLLAGIAPMATVVALTVLAIALGNGAGVPGTYLVAGAILALFAVGYVRMSGRLTNAGAFYTYATQGLGRRVGGATAYIAVLPSSTS